jgi:hypothetical protein
MSINGALTADEIIFVISDTDIIATVATYTLALFCHNLHPV